ncbi:hypothetical protein IV102_13835 [bacterium]|nr:hypothetical protein [bacterium]
MSMNVTSFNFLKPQPGNTDIAQRFTELRKKLEDAKDTFSNHQSDAFVRTTADDKSAVLAGVKTSEGSVTGVHREGVNGSEDLEVVTNHVETRGNVSGVVSHQIALHRDEQNPKLLTMSETDFFGNQMNYQVNEETGEVMANRSRVELDNGLKKLEPFNVLHPKTLNDAEGVAALGQLERKLDTAKTALWANEHQGHTQSTGLDRSLVMDGVKTDKGTLTGVLRESEGGILDMEARFSDSSGGGYVNVSTVGLHQDQNNPNQVVLMDGNSYYQTEFRMDQSTGMVIPTKNRVAEEEFMPAQREFNHLHPKTLSDAKGAVEFKSLQEQLQDIQAALTSPQASQSKEGVKTEGGWVTGRYDTGNGELQGAVTTSFGSKQFNVSRFGNTVHYTARQEMGWGTEYQVDTLSGQVQAKRLSA